MNIISTPFCSRFTCSHADSNNFLIISCRSADAGLDSSLRYDMFNRFFSHRDMVAKDTHLTSLNNSKSLFLIKLQVILVPCDPIQSSLIQFMWWDLSQHFCWRRCLFCSSLVLCQLVLKAIKSLLQLFLTQHEFCSQRFEAPFLG